MKDRAIRRRQQRKAKRQAVKILKGWHARITPEGIGKIASSKTPCSCAMCGNPRKYFKAKTMQELRHEPYEKEDDENSSN